MTGTSLGNGVTETYGYDANRMQLTSQTATKSGGPTNGLMNLNYYYQASAGQMGAGSTAGNAGQLMAINNNSTIGGVAESAAYSYDNLGRLVTSEQGSNGQSAQRRFAYDRFGNRTRVWDATSGGNQIQAITLEQSGGAPTNRIQSVTGPGKTNFALAANGASATASSSFSASYPASAAIDGDRKGTNWGGGGGWMDGTAEDFPDWLEVDFSENKTIDEIDVFTVQDDYENPSEPTENLTFEKYGITDFEVWRWGRFGWSLIASVTENDKVWKKITFSPITTDKIRVHITGAADRSYSRVTEVEAWGAAITTSNYLYDAAGNVTNDGVHSYVYDAENRLVSVDGGATGQYSYDQSNQRYKKVTVGSTTHYIWQGSKMIAEHDGSTGAVLIDYVYSGSRMIAKVEGGVTQYFLSDRLSTRLVLDTSGNVIGRQGHLAFGEDFAKSGTQEKHHFTSYERDTETALDYGLNRYNASDVGRFNQVDALAGNSENPQSLNRFVYVGDDPVNRTDPLGLGWVLRFICAGGDGCSWIWSWEPGSGEPSQPSTPVPSIPLPNVPGGPHPSPRLTSDQLLRNQLAKALRNLRPRCVAALGGRQTLRDRARQVEEGYLGFQILIAGSPESRQVIPGAPPSNLQGGGIWTFYDYWNANIAPSGPVHARAITVGFDGDFLSYHTVMVGPSFFNGTGGYGSDIASSQAITLIHEYLHYLNNANDMDLAKQLGLDAKGYDIGDPNKASSAISTWLSRGCRDAP